MQNRITSAELVAARALVAALRAGTPSAVATAHTEVARRLAVPVAGLRAVIAQAQAAGLVLADVAAIGAGTLSRSPAELAIIAGRIDAAVCVSDLGGVDYT